MSDDVTFSNFDSSEYLTDPEAVAIYLNEMLQENNPELLIDALGQVAKARGMTEIAQATGLSRESLYKALRSDAQPRYTTVQSVMKAIGLQFKVEQVKHSEPKKAAKKAGTIKKKSTGKKAAA